MLIERPLSQGDTVSMRTVSGEEVVFTLESETDTQFRIKRPMVLAHTPQGFGLIPYMFTVDPDAIITIPKSAVISSCSTHPDMARDYLSKTTGLQL